MWWQCFVSSKKIEILIMRYLQCLRCVHGGEREHFYTTLRQNCFLSSPAVLNDAADGCG